MNMTNDLQWQNPKFSVFYHQMRRQVALNLKTKTHLKYPEKKTKDNKYQDTCLFLLSVLLQEENKHRIPLRI